MTILKSFCGCFSLEAGGVILGFFGVVQDIILSVFCVINLININNNDVPIFFKYGNPEHIEIALGFSLAMAVINLLISVMLIIGTVQKKCLLLLPWLIMNFLGVLCSGFAFFIMITVNQSVLIFMLFSINLYIWLIVLSLYKTIKESYKYGSTTVNSINNRVIWKSNEFNNDNNSLPPYVHM